MYRNISKAVKDINNMKTIQGLEGNIDQGDYMVGLYNGLELASATIENRKPDLKDCDKKEGKATFDFGEAIKYLKKGYKVSRLGWNGKDQFVVYQKGYPQGIPCNKQTAEAWGMNEGDLFKCEPYLQMQNVQGSHVMWVASISDILADDWTFYK